VIDPVVVLEGIRTELKDTVLPRLADEHERSRVVAMLGILRDITAELEANGPARWEATNAMLSSACQDAVGALRPDDEVALRVQTLRVHAERAVPAQDVRQGLLAAAQELIRAAWTPERAVARERILATLRPALGADLRAQDTRTPKAEDSA
jgi:hypothetical protein